MGKIRQALSIVVFCILLFFVVYKTSHLLEYKDSQREYQAFYDCDTDIDVLFLGTSHMYNSVFPQVLWDEYGITSYNWGYSNCTVPINYYLVQELIKEKRPQVVVLDLFGLTQYEELGNGKYRSDRLEQQHVQFDIVPLSMNKYYAAKDIFDDYDGYMDFCFDFIKYHNRWEEIGESDFDITYSTEKGAAMLVGHSSRADYVPFSDTSFFVNELEYTVDTDLSQTTCYQYLLSMLEYCSSNNITLLCTYLPYPAESNEQLEAYVLADVINSYEGCYYVDMVEPPYLNGIDMETDIFSDGSHLNYSGGYKTSMMLGEILTESFGVISHKDQPEYSSWDLSYNEFVDYKADMISGRDNLIEMLMLMQGNDFSMSIVENVESEVIENDSVAMKYIGQMPSNIAFSKADIDAEYIVNVYRLSTGEEICSKSF